MSTLCTPLGLEAQRTFQQGVPPQRCCNGRAGGRLMRTRRTFVATERMPTAIANIMDEEGMSNGIQQGHGTDWGHLKPIPKLEG